METMTCFVGMTYLIGNRPIGNCCTCDTKDSKGHLIRHVDQYQLFCCTRCGDLACPTHYIDGLCYGCYMEDRIK